MPIKEPCSNAIAVAEIHFSGGGGGQALQISNKTFKFPKPPHLDSKRLFLALL